AGEASPERLIEALRMALDRVKGTYGLAVMHRALPGYLAGARLGSPLVLGIGKGEHFLASDGAALAPYTREAIFLSDHDLVCVRADGYRFFSEGAHDSGRGNIRTVELAPDGGGKGPFPHFMLKEIFEQPDAVSDAMRGRLSVDEATAKFGGLNMTPRELREIDRVVLIGCGSARHAAMVGEHLIETLAKVPVEVEFAS